jgi:hypothetical protein
MGAFTGEWRKVGLWTSFEHQLNTKYAACRSGVCKGYPYKKSRREFEKPEKLECSVWLYLFIVKPSSCRPCAKKKKIAWRAGSGGCCSTVLLAPHGVENSCRTCRGGPNLVRTPNLGCCRGVASSRIKPAAVLTCCSRRDDIFDEW